MGCDPEEWPDPTPDSHRAWSATEESHRVVSDRSSFIEDLLLTPRQIQTEVARRAKAIGRLGFVPTTDPRTEPTT